MVTFKQYFRVEYNGRTIDCFRNKNEMCCKPQVKRKWLEKNIIPFFLYPEGIQLAVIKFPVQMFFLHLKISASNILGRHQRH